MAKDQHSFAGAADLVAHAEVATRYLKDLFSMRERRQGLGAGRASSSD